LLLPSVRAIVGVGDKGILAVIESLHNEALPDNLSRLIILKVHFLPYRIDLMMGKTNKAKELVLWHIKGHGLQVFNLLHSFRIRLGVGWVECVHHYDCSFASLGALSHNLAIYKPRLDTSTEDSICH